jgi:hypothetical protein
MLEITTPLVVLLAPFSACFSAPVFAIFQVMVAAWIVCLGRRTISRVWQTTGRAQHEGHSKAYRLFNQAVWNWDDLARVMLLELLCDLIPGSSVWVVVDDTLCHKRGASVAFGGIFLDAVLSSRKHKVFRYGVNWVTLGVVVQLPFRKDRFFCVNLLWRVYSKKVKDLPHRTKSQLARQMLDLVAAWLPQRTVRVVADNAYLGKHLLEGLPARVHAIGPIHPRASLTGPLPAEYQGRRKKGPALPNPTGMLTDPAYAPKNVALVLPNGEKKKLQVKVIKAVCWYPVLGQRQIQLVLVHDPAGDWRDEMLLSTDPELSAKEVILGYMRRWSVEVCYWESKGLLGLHEAQVWSELGVQRAHPMAWFVGGLVLLWYAREGQTQEQARWARPWYRRKKQGPSFADMLATMRLHLWRVGWREAADDERNDLLDWLFHYVSTAMG